MIIERLFGWIDRTPGWLQPAAIGASIFAVIAAARGLILIPFMFGQPRLLASALEAIAISAAGGASGGLAYTILGRRLLAVRWVGRYLAGIVCAAAYLLSLIVVIPFVFPDLPPRDRGAFDLHDPSHARFGSAVRCCLG
jgi:hypothetical protein